MKLKYRMQSWRRRLREWVVLQSPVSEREARRRESHQRALARADFERQLVIEKESLRKIVEKLSGLEWRRDRRDHYAVTVMMDERMLSECSAVRGDLELVAEHIGRKVQWEIATSRFVQSAHETELRDEERRYARNGINRL